MFKRLWLFAILLINITACDKYPNQDQLNQWHQETLIENQRLSELYEVTNKQRQWQLVIKGETGNNEIYNFDWSELESLANTYVPTEEPHPGKIETIANFKGVLVSQLVDMAGIKDDVEEIIFVCDDSYIVAVNFEDIKKYNIILAIEKDEKPIPRTEGGPLFLVFPHSQFPELKEKYPATHWAFYVTHLIAEGAPLNLKVNQTILDQKSFDNLPQTVIQTNVEYKLYWPNGKIKLQGVKLKDLLKAQNIEIKPDSEIIIRGLANIHKDVNNPIIITGEKIESCPIILASRWGDKLMPIPSKMGGNITLAFDPSCEKKSEEKLPWITLVKEIEVN